MSEWGLPPEYVSRRWTDELLCLMLLKLIEKNERLKNGGKPAGGSSLAGIPGFRIMKAGSKDGNPSR